MGKPPVKTPSKPIGKATPKLPQNRKQEPPATPQTRMHRRLWLASKAAFGFAVVIIGIVGSVYTVVGPPWPTAPVFSPGPPSFGTAFDIPFTVENKSAGFGISNVKITCVVTVSFIGSPEGSPPQLDRVGVQAGGIPASLAAVGSGGISSGLYRCPLRDVRIGFGGKNAVKGKRFGANYVRQ